MSRVHYFYGERSTAPDGRPYFKHVFGHRRAVEACGCPKKEVVRLIAREVPSEEATEDHYWAWGDVEDHDLSMVWFAETLFRCCFTYGVEVEVEAGKGRVVRLAIEEEEDWA